MANKKITAILLAAALAFGALFGLAPGWALPVKAATAGAFTVTGGAQGTDWDYSSPVLTVKTNTPIEIANTTPGTPTADRIVIDSGVTDGDVTLSGVNIDVSGAGDDSAAFVLGEGGAKVTLILNGENILKSAKGAAGLHVPEDAELTINCKTDDSDSLVAAGGSFGAGIGGMNNSAQNAADKRKSCGIITINGGSVDATGAQGAAGIGGGERGAAVQGITINGGVVKAIAKLNAAAIGGGFTKAGDNITITGGVVTALGWDATTGIGGSFGGGARNIIISGGVVYAESYDGPGIGDSFDGSVNGVYITGGTVTAISKFNAFHSPGIGSVGDILTNLVISGGSVLVETKGGRPRPPIYDDNDIVIPTNGAGDLLYMNTLTLGDPALSRNTAITAGSIGGLVNPVCDPVQDTRGMTSPTVPHTVAPSGGYGIYDVQTDGDSKVYLWLPETVGVEPVTLTSGGVRFDADYTRPATAFAQVLTPFYELTANKGAGGDTVTGGGFYADGDTVAITATASSGYHFVDWTATGGSLAVATSASTTFTMPAAAVTLTANFAADPPPPPPPAPDPDPAPEPDAPDAPPGGGYTYIPTATVTPTPTATPAPIAAPQSTPSPTATPTPTIAPTATPSPTATAAPAPEPSPTDTAQTDNAASPPEAGGDENIGEPAPEAAPKPNPPTGQADIGLNAVDALLLAALGLCAVIRKSRQARR